jgi:hypothetical protein
VNGLAGVKLGGKRDVEFAAPCYGRVDTNIEPQKSYVEIRKLLMLKVDSGS